MRRVKKKGVKDVTGNRTRIFLAALVFTLLLACMLTACGNQNAQAQQAQQDAAAAEEVVEEAVAEEVVEDAAEEVVEEAVEEEVAEAASDITYVDGFYANDGESDFMIAFYENAPGDVCYVNDGTNEVLAEYTV